MNSTKSTALKSTFLLALLCIGAYFSITLGDKSFSPTGVLKALIGTADAHSTFVIRGLRLPRLTVAMIVGAALGLAGMVLQSLTRNPLASPDVLGIVTGAGTGAVALIVATGEYGGISGRLATIGLPIAAMIGAFISTFLLHLLSRNEHIVLVLAIGVGIQAFFAAMTAWLLLQASIVDAGRAIVWLTGSLNAVTLSHALPVAGALALALTGVAFTHQSLQVLALGNYVAVGLGVAVSRVRFVLLTACILLAATATAAAGPIAFVALGAPQLAQRFYRTPAPPVIGSLLSGAVLVLWADWIGRAVFNPALPVGVVTAALGAPLLMYLLLNSMKGQ